MIAHYKHTSFLCLFYSTIYPGDRSIVSTEIFFHFYSCMVLYSGSTIIYLLFFFQWTFSYFNSFPIKVAQQCIVTHIGLFIVLPVCPWNRLIEVGSSDQRITAHIIFYIRRHWKPGAWRMEKSWRKGRDWQWAKMWK